MFKNQPKKHVTEEEQRLINEAVSQGRITKVQPAAASSNEMSRATRELVARRRREFRKANK